MTKWQASKSDLSPRKGYVPEIEPELCWCPLGEWCDSDHNESTCNCLCGCDVPLDWGTCVDCSENNDHQNNNELTQFLQPLIIRNGEVFYVNDEKHNEEG